MRLKDTAEHYLGTLSGAAAPFQLRGLCAAGRFCVQSTRPRRGRRWSWASGWQSWSLAARSACAAQSRCPSRWTASPACYDAIVPVPASGTKRGYNVPELMARPLAKGDWASRCTANALGRARTEAAIRPGCSFDERLANVAGAFRVTGPGAGRAAERVHSGGRCASPPAATAAACAQALLAAGAAKRVRGGAGYGGI